MRRRSVRPHRLAAACALATALASPTAAHAEPESRLMISLPFTVGTIAVSDGDWDLSTGWRPELLFALYDRDTRTGWAMGPYLELTVVSWDYEHVWKGCGMTAARYLRGGVGVALSAGIAVDSDTDDGDVELPTFGAFVGHRDPEHLPRGDIPIGLRVDVRPGMGATRTEVAVLVQVDVIAGLVKVALAFDAWSRRLNAKLRGF